MISFIEKLAFIFLVSHDVEILITLSYRKRCVRSQEFVAEDLGQEDVVGLVFGFELVAADGAVCAAEVAWFPGFVQRTEGVGDVLGQLRAGGGVNGIRARETLESPEPVEEPGSFSWIITSASLRSRVPTLRLKDHNLPLQLLVRVQIDIDRFTQTWVRSGDGGEANR